MVVIALGVKLTTKVGVVLASAVKVPVVDAVVLV